MQLLSLTNMENINNNSNKYTLYYVHIYMY